MGWLRAAIGGLALAAAVFLAGCSPGGGADAPDGDPTQTPVYVVITSTPTPSGPGADAPVPEDPAGTPSPAGGEEVAPTDPASVSVPSAPAPLVPAPIVCQSQVMAQAFEFGTMFWLGGTFEERCKTEHDFRPGSGVIWVALTEGGRRGWLTLPDEWIEGVNPESDPDLNPPEGTIQPVRSFGYVWREKLTDEQRNALGWAVSEPETFVTTYRYDVGGAFTASGSFEPGPGLHRIQASDGGEFFFYEQPGLIAFRAPGPPAE